MKYIYNQYDSTKPFTEIFSKDINCAIDVYETESDFAPAFLVEVNQPSLSYQLEYSYADVFLMLSKENPNWSHQGYDKNFYAEDYLRIIRKDVMKTIFAQIIKGVDIPTHEGISTTLESLDHVGDFCMDSDTTFIKVMPVNFYKNRATYLFIKATSDNCRKIRDKVAGKHQICKYGICANAVAIKIGDIITEKEISELLHDIDFIYY